jgi:hypothetical protein
MTETQTNSAPHPPITARKPIRTVSSPRRSIGNNKPHQNLAYHGLIPLEASTLDVENVKKSE